MLLLRIWGVNNTALDSRRIVQIRNRKESSTMSRKEVELRKDESLDRSRNRRNAPLLAAMMRVDTMLNALQKPLREELTVNLLHILRGGNRMRLQAQGLVILEDLRRVLLRLTPVMVQSCKRDDEQVQLIRERLTKTPQHVKNLERMLSKTSLVSMMEFSSSRISTVKLIQSRKLHEKLTDNLLPRRERLNRCLWSGNPVSKKMRKASLKPLERRARMNKRRPMRILLLKLSILHEVTEVAREPILRERSEPSAVSLRNTVIKQDDVIHQGIRVLPKEARNGSTMLVNYDKLIIVATVLSYGLFTRSDEEGLNI
nr:MAG TPA: hypothetical protein [Caudoviricetes sp.]